MTFIAGERCWLFKRCSGCKAKNPQHEGFGYRWCSDCFAPIQQATAWQDRYRETHPELCASFPGAAAVAYLKTQRERSLA